MKRRSFIRVLSVLIIWLQWPLMACKRQLRPNLYAFDDDENANLTAVLNHLLPKDGNRPGASDIQATFHLNRIMRDPSVRDFERRRIKSGLAACINQSIRIYDAPFYKLSKDEKEKILKKMAATPEGERWLSTLLNYIFEALLGDPVYGINRDMAGWKWLQHVPGFPRPDDKNKYQWT